MRSPFSATFGRSETMGEMMLVRSVRFAVFILVALLLVESSSAAADPLDPKDVPEPLRPWTAWALDGRADARCPTLLNRGDLSSCIWPSHLELEVDARGGRFVQRWHVDVAGRVPLPGDGRRWPVDVAVDGRRTVVLEENGRPTVGVLAGDHLVVGAFAWDGLPDSIATPPETGLLALRIQGAPVPWPNRDVAGVVWLQKDASPDEGDALEIVVSRKLTDGVPVALTTRIELHASGKSRDAELGRALPPTFVPVSLDSPLPARLEPDGRLRIQLRPGIHVITLLSRSTAPVGRIARPSPAGPWAAGDEVWAFEASPEVRVVTVEGVAPVDPQQTRLPEAWRRLPAYPMGPASALILTEKRRGDEQPGLDRLSLVRDLWLDFDGGGVSVRDRITGAVNQASRLTMPAPATLGRVSIGGRDQLITRVGDAAPGGVEVRRGELRMTADSRIDGDVRDIPAVGWANDFHQVTGTLHLPPGWRLVHASGVDDVPGAWLKEWTLVDLFLAIITAIAMGRLYGARWGVLALSMLFLTLPEREAPHWIWLAVLAAEALVRLVPASGARRLLHGVRAATVALLAIAAIPFLVRHVREGMYPVLTSESALGAAIGDTEETAPVHANENERASAKGTPEANASNPPLSRESRGGAPAAGGFMAAAPPIPAPAPQAPAEPAPASPPEPLPSDVLATNAATGAGSEAGRLTLDPRDAVQTGPGLPTWQGSSLALQWSGPVAATQRLHLVLLSPSANFVLAAIRAILVLLVGVRLLAAVRLGWPLAGAAVAACALLFPARARADVPDPALLDQLAARLTRKPSCAPACAASPRMRLEVRDGALAVRLEVEAEALTAVPLPGGRGGWSPDRVMLDGRAAPGLTRTADGALWAELGPGFHQIAMIGALPDLASVHVPLPLKPHHVERFVPVASGWSISGVHEDGLADDDLELTRLASTDPRRAALEPSTLPPFVRVDRTLHVGLEWTIDTQVERVTPEGAAIALEIPLVPGESVTTPEVRVAAGKALVNLGAQAKRIAWRSTIEPRSSVVFVAPDAPAWTEIWRVDVAPLWHAAFGGIPSIHAESASGAQTPEWRPWPGETLQVALTRPESVAGRTLTIDASHTDVRPGMRAADVTLEVEIRSSRGGEHTIALPPDAQLESMTIDGRSQPIHQERENVTFPVAPGRERVVLAWREPRGLRTLYSPGKVDLGAASVNATQTILLPATQWLLLTGGPAVGPVVLFWSLLLVLLAVSILLARNRWTPLRWWQWFLLSIGLSQVNVVAGVVFVGWLLACGWRARSPGATWSRRRYNVRQIGLAVWTAIALGILVVSLAQGLLGAPEMQVEGNGSDRDALRWFTDRAGPVLPSPWFISVPMLVYRSAMLGWALWIALALLGWLRWAWDALHEGGIWRPEASGTSGAVVAPAATAPAAPTLTPEPAIPVGETPTSEAPIADTGDARPPPVREP